LWREGRSAGWACSAPHAAAAQVWVGGRGAPGCRYTPDARGFFAGQTGYGYISIAKFLETAGAVTAGDLSLADVT